MTRILHRTTIAILLACLLTLGFTVASVAPAAAEHPSGEEDDTIADVLDADDDGIAATVKAFAAGLSKRGTTFASSVNPFSSTTPASDHANDTQSTFNENSADLVAYANNRDLAGWFEHYSDRTNNVDVVKVTFTDPDGGEATRYVVAQYNASSGDYDSAEMTSSTSHTVDSTVELSPTASMNVNSDFEAFINDYVESDENPPTSYRRGLGAQYGGSVESPLIPDVGLTGLMEGL